MSNNVFTPKQQQLLSLLKHDKLKRINILEGSVRSGKTWISLVLWAFWIGTRPMQYQYLMCAKTLQSLKRNCLDLLVELVGEDNFTYSLSSKEGLLFGRKILLEGANDVKAEQKIRGLTLGGAYCDELTLFLEDFFSMLLSRLSVDGAKLFGTTNPDRPTHWLKVKYLDRAAELNLMSMQFLIDDNTFLSTEYIEDMKREQKGVFYERFIKGRWVVAEGAIYQYFNDNKTEFVLDNISPSEIVFATIGVDFGGNGSAHTFVCTGYTKGYRKVITLAEYYKKGDQIATPSVLEYDFINFVRECRRLYPVRDVYCDSAEQLLIKGFRQAVKRAKLSVSIHNARKNPVNDRIRFFNRLMGEHRYYVLKSCKKVIEGLEDAVWDSKAEKDVRLDNGTSNIDSLDALEYGVEPYMNDLMRNRGGN